MHDVRLVISGGARQRRSLEQPYNFIAPPPFLGAVTTVLEKELRPSQGIAVVLGVADGRVGTGGEERARNLHMIAQNREVQWRERIVPMTPACVGIRAMLEQPLNCDSISALRHQMQYAFFCDGIRILAHQPLGSVPIAGCN